MDDLKLKISKAYEAINLLKALNLPESQEQKDTIASLEKEYILSTIIPDVKEIIEGDVFDNLQDFNLTVSYSSENGVDISIEEKPLENESFSSAFESTKKHDTTRFSIDGVQFFNKKQFVHKVVSQYIEDHPSVTIEELESVFPSEIYGKTNGVVRRWEDVQRRIVAQPDLVNRYFTEPDKRITLKDGTEIVVNNQWGNKFGNFLVVAKRLYNVTSSAPYSGI